MALNEFGTLIDKHLTSLGWRKLVLARKSDYSPPYITSIMNGLRTPSPEAVTRVASAMDLSEDDTTELHEAAARVHGYMIKKTQETAAQAAS